MKNQEMDGTMKELKGFYESLRARSTKIERKKRAGKSARSDQREKELGFMVKT